MSFEALAREPRSTSWRLVRRALLCLMEFTIFFSMAAATGTVNGVASPFGWPLGIWLWGVSLALVVFYVVVAGTIKRAILFYVLEHAASGLGMAGLVVLGLSIIAHLLARDVFLTLAGGIVAGWATMVARIPAKRRWFDAAIERGHLARSLNREHASWSPQYDLDQAAKELRDLEGRGCLVRLLPWIGPAIGMVLADVVGRWNTMVFVALILLGLGYWGFGVLTVDAIARILGLRRLEAILGRPILLAEDDNASKE